MLPNDGTNHTRRSIKLTSNNNLSTTKMMKTNKTMIQITQKTRRLRYRSFLRLQYLNCSLIHVGLQDVPLRIGGLLIGKSARLVVVETSIE